MSKNLKDIQRRISINMGKELDNIKVERIRMGLDDKFISDARLTEAMIKDPSFMEIKNKLIKAKRKEELK